MSVVAICIFFETVVTFSEEIKRKTFIYFSKTCSLKNLNVFFFSHKIQG